VWALAGTLALTAAALWASKPAAFVEAVARSDAQAAAQVPVAAVTQCREMGSSNATLTPSTPLPNQWPVQALEPAKRDVFSPVLPPAPKLVPVKVAVVAAPASPPIPAPMAPPMNYRFFGQMHKPDGERIVFLARGDKSVEVAVGAQLDDGYVVESISDEGVQLIYPALGQRAVVGITPARQ